MGTGEDGVNAITSDLGFDDSWDPLELLDSDPGSFALSGDGTCIAYDAAKETGGVAPQPMGPIDIGLTASGHFNNLACGTLMLGGDAGLAGRYKKMSIKLHIAATTIERTGRLGLVVDDDAPGNIGDSIVSAGEGGGMVHLAPQTGNCVTTKATDFVVYGSFALRLSGEGSDSASNGKDSNA